ncbi:MAG TPA: type 1 glutamine amidotransferase family protein [Methanospirillum sp.]|nr:type 1 glutamine amidotransferase family protein [Methanospirillum sp.]
MTRIIYLFILDTMADWEPGYVLAELGSGRFFQFPEKRYQLLLCGRTREPITTMGGVHLVPDLSIEEIQPGADHVLILPGADTWLDPIQAPVLEMVRKLLETDMVIAAICGATMGLAQTGLLNNRKHTSNDLQALKMFCPEYSGDTFYTNEPAITDGNLITATGLAPIDFAKQIFIRLNVMKESTLNAWYLLHTTREPEYYHTLIESLT